MKRVFYTWDKWECYPAGFFETKPKDKSLSADVCRNLYASFVRDLVALETGMEGVLRDWPRSTEHNLTNERMNRIGWLHQAAVCYTLGIPAAFSGGLKQLTPAEQDAANQSALRLLNRWMVERGEQPIPMDKAMPDIKANLY